MDLKNALEILLACSNNIQHDAFTSARETVQAFIDESLGTNPSPLRVEIQKSVKEGYHKVIVNVPAEVVYRFGSMVPVHLPTTVDPCHNFLNPEDYV